MNISKKFLNLIAGVVLAMALFASQPVSNPITAELAQIIAKFNQKADTLAANESDPKNTCCGII